MDQLDEALESCNSSVALMQGDESHKGKVLVLTGRISSHLGKYESAVQNMTEAYLIDHDYRTFS